MSRSNSIASEYRHCNDAPSTFASHPSSRSRRGSEVDEDCDETATASMPTHSSFLIVRLLIIAFRIIFRPVREFFYLLTWIVWLFSSITLSTGHLSIVLYSAARITISLFLYLLVRVCFQLLSLVDILYSTCLRWSERRIPKSEKIRRKKGALEEATTLEQWQRIAFELDR